MSQPHVHLYDILEVITICIHRNSETSDIVARRFLLHIARKLYYQIAPLPTYGEMLRCVCRIF